MTALPPIVPPAHCLNYQVRALLQPQERSNFAAFVILYARWRSGSGRAGKGFGTSRISGAGGFLIRVGLRSLAAAGTAFAIGFVFYTCLPHDAGSADAAPRALEVDASTAIAEAHIRNNARPHLASLGAGDDLLLGWQNTPSEPISARAAFTERFAFDRPDASLQASEASVSFDDRFSGEGLASGGPVRSAAAAPHTTLARAATAAAAPVPRAAPKRAPKAGFQLASASEMSLPLGYAPADRAKSSGLTGSLNGLVPNDSDPLADMDTSRTAIYDITSHTVYLPNGRRLEAHSGLGSHMDDPRYVARRNTGPTPPNVYELKMRESLFHGVRAIRLIPKDHSKMNGRSGILAHSYLLGPTDNLTAACHSATTRPSWTHTCGARS